MWNFTPTLNEDYWKQGTHENICTQEGETNRRLEKIMSNYTIYIIFTKYYYGYKIKDNRQAGM
jgi:hypothetical protein